MYLKTEPAYEPLGKGDVLDESERGACLKCHHCSHGQRRSRTELVSILTSVVLFIALVVVSFMRLDRGATCDAVTSKTDFAPAEGLIEYKDVRFSGTAAFDANGTAYRLTNPDEPQFVGEPSPEIDAAWDSLIGGRNFYLTDDEAKAAWGERYTEFYHDKYGIRAELDVLHTLHCVNKIRQALSPEYYHLSPGSAFNRYHFDHCIDILRQSVQCSGDLTLIPTRWFEGAHRRFIDSDQVHTCRNFQKIREWATERHNGTTAVHQIGVSKGH